MIGELTNHLWQSTMFSVLAGLMTVAFRKNRAQVCYWLWLSASFKFLIPFWLLMSLGSHLEWAPAAQKIAAPAVSFTMVQIAQPFPDTLPAAPHSRGSHDWAPMAMLGVWACGLGTIALIRFRDWLRIRAAVRSSTPIDLPATVEIRSSPGLLEPGVVGWLHPTLLLPVGITEQLTPHQLDAVLAHELCHVRRRDNLTSAIHMIVEAVFWFHPLVWWIGGRLLEARERACDEAVLNLGSEPRDYAEGILTVCKSYLESPLQCVSGVSGSDLKKRIHAIMTGRVAAELTLAKKIALSTAGIAALAGPIVVGMMNAPAIQAQSATAAVTKFEVTSIKPCKVEPGGLRAGGESSPGRLSTGCELLVDHDNLGLIQRAYVRFAGGHSNSARVLRIEGGPGWIHSEMFAIEAKAEGHTSMEMMAGPMMQALLEDRFKLKIHRETRQGPVYDLTLAKGGSKLKPFQEGSCAPMPSAPPFPPLPPGQAYCTVVVSPEGSLDAEGSGLTGLSGLLSLILDRQVIDKTGIAGKFDIHLRFSPDQLTAGQHGPPADTPEAPTDSTGPTIFTAIQEQLGLKLVPAKGPIEVLIIDHVEKPSEN